MTPLISTSFIRKRTVTQIVAAKKGNEFSVAYCKHYFRIKRIFDSRRISQISRKLASSFKNVQSENLVNCFIKILLVIFLSFTIVICYCIRIATLKLDNE